MKWCEALSFKFLSTALQGVRTLNEFVDFFSSFSFGCFAEVLNLKKLSQIHFKISRKLLRNGLKSQFDISNEGVQCHDLRASSALLGVGTPGLAMSMCILALTLASSAESMQEISSLFAREKRQGNEDEN